MTHENLSDSEVKRAFDTVVSATPELSTDAVERLIKDARQYQSRSMPRTESGWRFAGGAGLIAATAAGFWIGAVPLASLELSGLGENNEAYWQATDGGVVSALSMSAEQESDNG